MARISPTGGPDRARPPQGVKKEKEKPLGDIVKKVKTVLSHEPIRPAIPSVQKRPPSETKGLVKRINKAFSRLQPSLAKL